VECNSAACYKEMVGNFDTKAAIAASVCEVTGMEKVQMILAGSN